MICFIAFLFCSVSAHNLRKSCDLRQLNHVISTPLFPPLQTRIKQESPAFSVKKYSRYSGGDSGCSPSPLWAGQAQLGGSSGWLLAAALRSCPADLWSWRNDRSAGMARPLVLQGPSMASYPGGCQLDISEISHFRFQEMGVVSLLQHSIG